MFEIKVIRLNGGGEVHYSDAPVDVGGRLRVAGRKLAVIKRVRSSTPGIEAVYICLEVPAPERSAWSRAA